MLHEEFIQDFIDETVGHLEEFEQAMMRCVQGDVNPETINSLFRSVHSIKGTAGFFSLHNFVNLAHAMENRLAEVRNGKAKLETELLERLLNGGDVLKQLLENVHTSNEMDIKDTIQLFAEPIAPSSKTEAIDEKRFPFPGVELFIDPEDEQSEELQAELASDDHSSKPSDRDIQASTAKLDPVPSVAESNAKSNKEKPDKSSNKQSETRNEETVRVNVQLLNDLMDLSGEMVLARNQLMRMLTNHFKNVTGLPPIVERIDQLTSNLQEKVMQTRMQPIAKVFQKFPRMIHDLNRAAGKNVELTIEENDVEMDKSLIEGLSDPLTHLLRNAIDHGIESPELRKQNGKTSIGQVLLRAFHEGDHVIIEMKDDGGGINAQKIGDIAVEKGLISHADRLSRSDDDLIRLIFMPGFSTKQEASSLSGRGVGMDVVKTNIEKMGGSISIHTRLGQGTTFRLLLPLTMAVVPSIIVFSGERIFAVPQVHIEEIIRVKPFDEFWVMEQVQNVWTIRLRGQVLPIVHLSDLLGETENRFEQIAYVFRILVISIGSFRYGLGVDRILDREDILIKPLPRYYRHNRNYFGVTIMGDGKPAMILDLEGIAEMAQIRTHDSEEMDERVIGDGLIRSTLMLIRSNLGERFAVDLSHVLRVEKVNPESIQIVGGEEVIPIRGEMVKIIKLSRPFPFAQTDQWGPKSYLILPNRSQYPVGLLVPELLYTAKQEVHFVAQPHVQEGLFGCCIVEDHVTQLLDIYQIITRYASERLPEPILSRSQTKFMIVVIHNEYMRKYYERLFMREGWIVNAFETMDQAMHFVAEESIPSYDYIIMDEWIDGMNSVDWIDQFEMTPGFEIEHYMILTNKMHREMVERTRDLRKVTIGQMASPDRVIELMKRNKLQESRK